MSEKKKITRRKALKIAGAGAVVVAAAAVGAYYEGLFRPLTNPETPVASTPESWAFGVMGDTQWTCLTDPAGENPNGVAVSIINQVNQEFIKKGVKFVIQVGDLTEHGFDADIAIRATAAKTLYDAGIGFFGMRGNHETYANSFYSSGAEYPGPANGSIDYKTNGNQFAIPAIQSNFPQTRGNGGNTFGAANFSSDTSVSSYLDGMAYSFDYGTPGDNARFIIIDEWVCPDKEVDTAGYPFGHSVGEQQSWIDGRLDMGTRGTTHAFLFFHQPIMPNNHQDCLFSGYTNANPDMQNVFYASVKKNGAKYCISGHDHMYQRSLVASPDGTNTIEELVCASVSSKFYGPKALNDPNWFGQKYRETSISQELYTVGYYIFTVQGPNVTVDYYSDDHGNWASDDDYPGNGMPKHVTPSLNFTKKETWGYSTNGKEFMIGGTGSADLAVIQDSFKDTVAKILSGTYANTAIDYTKRVLTRAVNTGWLERNNTNLNSDVLTLWGMAPTGSQYNGSVLKTDTYTLSLSYGNGNTSDDGSFGLATKDANGNWVNAVSLNFGGTPKFVNGPWNSSYGLGTYGVDTATKTVWAVINHDGSFAAANGIRLGTS